MVQLSIDKSMSNPRRALGVINQNQKQDTSNTTPRKSLFKTSKKLSSKKKKHVPTTDKERQSLFDKVCLNRCPRDLDGLLLEEDLEEWSVDDFEYVRSLGKGGTASVFCAKEKQSGHLVAIKVQEASHEGLLEVDIHEPLVHPSIVKMIDYFYSDEPFGPIQDSSKEDGVDEEDDDDSDDCHPKKYLCMILELCDKSLFDAIRDAENGYFSEAQAASCFRDAVNAMKYLHDNETIHCDCKSLNFLLTKDGKMKLADFGMAVPFDEKEIVGGSPIYMAPEHLLAWRHMTDNFDHQSDIYSLGVLLFEMLVGYLPCEVVENDEDLLLAEMDALALGEDEGLSLPILDLRKLDDHTSDEPFYIPPIIFPDFVSREAQDLIMRLMEPVAEDRISLEEVKQHSWFLKHDLV